MKKLFIGSGILLALSVIMAFTGLTDYEDRKKAAFNEANIQYAAGQYEQAIELYNEASEKLDKYLHSGNASFKLGEAIEDPKQKLEFYQQAVKTYKQGVLKFPENVALKYNYEYVLEKIGPQDQQDQQDGDKSDEEQKENEEGQKQEDQEGEKQEGKEGESDKQEGEQPTESEQPGKQEGQQPAESEQPGKQEGEQSSEGQQGEQSSPSPGGESTSQTGLSDKELEQVMGMLEKQEEDSLKNNQEIKNEDKGEAYDW